MRFICTQEKFKIHKKKNLLADLNNFEKLETIFDKLESSALVPFFMKNMCRKKWKIGNLSLKIGKLNIKLAQALPLGFGP